MDLFRRMHLLADAGQRRPPRVAPHRRAGRAHRPRRAHPRRPAAPTVLEGEALTQEGIAAGLVTRPGRARGRRAGRGPRSARTRRPACGCSGWTHAGGRVRGHRPARAGPARSSPSSASRARGRASSSARSPGSSAATGDIEVGRRAGRARRHEADEPRLGRPPDQPVRQPDASATTWCPASDGRSPAGGGALRPRRMLKIAQRAARPVPGQGRLGRAADPVAVRREPAEGRDRGGDREAARGPRRSRSRRAAWTSARRREIYRLMREYAGERPRGDHLLHRGPRGLRDGGPRLRRVRRAAVGRRCW